MSVNFYFRFTETLSASGFPVFRPAKIHFFGQNIIFPIKNFSYDIFFYFCRLKFDL